MKYIINEDYYYTDPGCDCCKGDRFEIYTVADEDGNCLTFENEYGGNTEYTFSSKIEALEFILRLKEVVVEYTYKEEDYDF